MKQRSRLSGRLLSRSCRIRSSFFNSFNEAGREAESWVLGLTFCFAPLLTVIVILITVIVTSCAVSHFITLFTVSHFVYGLVSLFTVSARSCGTVEPFIYCIKNLHTFSLCRMCNHHFLLYRLILHCYSLIFIIEFLSCVFIVLSYWTPNFPLQTIKHPCNSLKVTNDCKLGAQPGPLDLNVLSWLSFISLGLIWKVLLIRMHVFACVCYSWISMSRTTMGMWCRHWSSSPKPTSHGSERVSHVQSEWSDQSVLHHLLCFTSSLSCQNVSVFQVVHKPHNRERLLQLLHQSNQ